MIKTSINYQKAIANDERSFSAITVDMTLKDGTSITLDETQIMSNGISFKNSCSGDNEFSLGSVVAEECTLKLNNINEAFNGVNFAGASFTISFSLAAAPDDVISKGPYTTGKPGIEEGVITLVGLDKMTLLDKKKLGNISTPYPTTLAKLAQDACYDCGIGLDETSLPPIYFGNDSSKFKVQSKPEGKDITYRQVISWIAQILGGYARINKAGKLQFYPFSNAFSGSIDGGSFVDYTSGDSVDGGNFTNYASGDSVDGGNFTKTFHKISDLFAKTVDTEEIVVKGATVFNTESEKAETVSTNNPNGNYNIVIEDNPLIQSQSQSFVVAQWVANLFYGFKFYPISVDTLTDLSVEVGDTACIIDEKGREYKTVFTSIDTSIMGSTTLACNASDSEDTI